MSVYPRILVAAVLSSLGGLACGDGQDAGEVAYNDKATDLGAKSVQAAIAALSAKVAELETKLADTETRLAYAESQLTELQPENAAQHMTLQTAITALETKTAAISAETVEGSAAVVFTGVNVHVRNGMGDTETTNGLGNLVVGYNERGSDVRTGSHNLVLGQGHEYTSYGGFIAGIGNAISGPYATVCGGFANSASGEWSTVSGGGWNSATAQEATVSGGYQNTAGHNAATVGGGRGRSTENMYNWVAGVLSQNQ